MGDIIYWKWIDVWTKDTKSDIPYLSRQSLLCCSDERVDYVFYNSSIDNGGVDGAMRVAIFFHFIFKDGRTFTCSVNPFMNIELLNGNYGAAKTQIDFYTNQAEQYLQSLK